MSFKNLNLNSQTLSQIKNLKYNNPTPIQTLAIPQILQNKNLIIISQTGTGKTATFVIPTLEKIYNNKEKTKILILAPTRELVIQIQETYLQFNPELKKNILCLYGNTKNTSSPKHLNLSEINIIIATPEKIYQHLTSKTISLKQITTLIIDEIDKLLETGFSHHLPKILKYLPKQRQNIFLSATISNNKHTHLETLINKPLQLLKTSQDTINTNLIKQQLYFVKHEHKYKLLLSILTKNKIKKCIIFSNSKKETDTIYRFLSNNKIESTPLHSSKSSSHREKTIQNINNNQINILISTDLASRGIDIKNFTHIINFDIPTNPNTYIHRIGRIGRNQNTGTAISFCSLKEKYFLNKIENLIQTKIPSIKHTLECKLTKKANPEKISPKPQKQKKPKQTKKNLTKYELEFLKLKQKLAKKNKQ